MPIKKVRPGADLEISARDWNAIADAVNWVRAQQGGLGRGAALPEIPQTGIITVRNDSGAARGRFDVLGLEQPIVLPSDNLSVFQSAYALSAITPAATHEGRWCLLLEPLADGKLGRACVAGVTVARLDVVSESHRFAEVVAGDTSRLHSGSSGTATILWAEPGTGERWGVIRIGGGSGDGTGGAGGGTGVTCGGVCAEEPGDITACDQCPEGMHAEYEVDFTSGCEAAGLQILTHDSDCLWIGETVTVDEQDAAWHLERVILGGSADLFQWRLTLVADDSTELVKYAMPVARPFCCDCSNVFTAECVPRCESTVLPTNVCVRPHIETPDVVQVPCCEFEVPGVLYLRTADTFSICPCVDGGEPIELRWDPTLYANTLHPGAWRSDWPGQTNFAFGSCGSEVVWELRCPGDGSNPDWWELRQIQRSGCRPVGSNWDTYLLATGEDRVSCEPFQLEFRGGSVITQPGTCCANLYGQLDHFSIFITDS